MSPSSNWCRTTSASDSLARAKTPIGAASMLASVSRRCAARSVFRILGLPDGWPGPSGVEDVLDEATVLIWDAFEAKSGWWAARWQFHGLHVQGGGEGDEKVQGDALPPGLDVGDRGSVHAGQAPERGLAEVRSAAGEADAAAELRIEVVHGAILTGSFQKCQSGKRMFITMTFEVAASDHNRLPCSHTPRSPTLGASPSPPRARCTSPGSPLLGGTTVATLPTCFQQALHNIQPAEDERNAADAHEQVSDALKTNPTRLNELTTQVNKDFILNGSGIYVPVVKLVRQTRRTWLGDQPGGFYFEIMTYWAFENEQPSETSVAGYLTFALETIAAMLPEVATDGLDDPTLADKTITTKATAADFQTAKTKITKAAKLAQAALEERDECKAAVMWRALLGETTEGDQVFPIPDYCNADGSRRSYPAVTTGATRVPAGSDRYT